MKADSTPVIPIEPSSRKPLSLLRSNKLYHSRRPEIVYRNFSFAQIFFRDSSSIGFQFDNNFVHKMIELQDNIGCHPVSLPQERRPKISNRKIR